MVRARQALSLDPGAENSRAVHLPASREPSVGQLRFLAFRPVTSQDDKGVTNFHRVTVHRGSSLEWLKLGIDPDATNRPSSTSFGPLSWQREPYTP